MNLDAFEPDRVEEVLYRHGAQAVTLTDAGDDPVLEPAPGATPLWRDTRITALFSANVDIVSLERDLEISLAVSALPEHHVESLPDRRWEREWLRDFGPMRFGKRLWIVPEAADSPADAGTVVRLDPGLAFGTGTHATTALCLEWLDGLDAVGRSVLDVGCGSGILGIAALKLGATRVTGIDIDPQALTATAENARRNGVDMSLSTADALQQSGQTFDIVVANILAGTLIDQSAAIGDYVASGGTLGLSGILADQAEAVMAAYRPVIDFVAPVCNDGWVLLAGRRI